MKTYNNFNEMFNANKSVKSDLSVFNVKISSGTENLIKQFTDLCDAQEDKFRDAYLEKHGMESVPDYEDKAYMKMEWAIMRDMRKFELNCPLRFTLMDSICDDFFLSENQAEYPIDMEYGAMDVVNAEYIDNFAKDAVSEVDARSWIDINYMDIASQLSEQIFGEDDF